MEKANHRSKRKVVKVNCSKNMGNCSKRKVDVANFSKNIVNCSKRKVVEAICSKNMEMEANWPMQQEYGQLQQEHGFASQLQQEQGGEDQQQQEQGSGGQLPKNMDNCSKTKVHTWAHKGSGL